MRLHEPTFLQHHVPLLSCPQAQFASGYTITTTSTWGILHDCIYTFSYLTIHPPANDPVFLNIMIQASDTRLADMIHAF